MYRNNPTTLLLLLLGLVAVATAIPTIKDHHLRHAARSQASTSAAAATGSGGGLASGSATACVPGPRDGLQVSVALLKKALLSPQGRTLDKVKPFIAALKAHVQKEFSLENVLFLENEFVSAYKWYKEYDAWSVGSDVEKKQLRNLFFKIYNKFIRTSAATPLNLKPAQRQAPEEAYAKMKKTGDERLELPPKGVLQETVKGILNLVATDSFQRMDKAPFKTPEFCTQLATCVVPALT